MPGVDVCGILCLCLLYGCVAYAEYALVVWMIVPVMSDSLWSYVHVAIFNLCLILALWAHGRASFGDPGVVPLPKTQIDFSTALQQQNNNNDWTICARCETYRPPHAHHCRICNRCVRRMDHHCPWINNCVGELNQKYFLQFLVYTGATCLYGTLVVVISWQLEDADEAGVPLSEYRQNRLIHTVIFLVECLLFGLFVLVIFCDQLSSVMHGPQQDTKSHGSSSQRRNKSCRSSMRDVCGRALSVASVMISCALLEKFPPASWQAVALHVDLVKVGSCFGLTASARSVEVGHSLHRPTAFIEVLVRALRIRFCMSIVSRHTELLALNNNNGGNGGRLEVSSFSSLYNRFHCTRVSSLRKRKLDKFVVARAV